MVVPASPSAPPTAPPATPAPAAAPPSPSPAPTSAVAVDTGLPGPEADPLPDAEAPAVLLEEWRRAGADPSCPPVAFPDPGEATGATARRANTTPEDWLVAYDRPGLRGRGADGYACEDCGRGVFGIGPVDVPPEEIRPALVEEPGIRRRWADGTTAWYAPDADSAGRDTSPHTGRIALGGHDCRYQVWSYLGRLHLEHLLDHARVVAADQ